MNTHTIIIAVVTDKQGYSYIDKKLVDKGSQVSHTVGVKKNFHSDRASPHKLSVIHITFIISIISLCYFVYHVTSECVDY